MRLEQIKNRPLSIEDELIFKKAYEKDGGRLWASPMTFAEYLNGVEEGRIILSENSHLYADRSKDRLGVTVEPVQSVSNADVTVHKRYSYPVLHNHDYVEVIYVAEGQCTHFLDNTSFEMKACDVCILDLNAMHALSCTNDESCILNIMVNRQFFDQGFLAILRGGDLLAGFLEGILYERTTSPYILFPTGSDPWLMTIAQHLLTEYRLRPHAHEYSIRLLVSEFLLHLVREYEMTAIVPNATTHAQNDLIVAILGYLSVNYNRTTLSKTAEFFGYSPSYLSRTIHDNTGKTFNAIILQLQMETAARLLKETRMNLTEIAQEIGCFDSSHFNKKFKGYYGCSPKQYLAGEEKEKDLR